MWPRHVGVAVFRLLDAHGGVVALRAAAGLLEDPDVKLRRWAGRCVQRWRPWAQVRRAEAEVGGLLDRSRHLFSDQVLRRREWEAGLDGGVVELGGGETSTEVGEWADGQPQLDERELLSDGPWLDDEVRRG